jgi:hydroxymethylpyrimidine pyrophosphatase-like HAD family hydrolase
LTPTFDTSAAYASLWHVDGTLVTPDKVVTPLAHAAVHALREAGIALTITTAVPPA